jgi:acyl-CoA thioesterase
MQPIEIVKKMMSKDSFSRWLGIEIISVEYGFCELRTVIKKEMTNGFTLSHGGIIFSVADSCLAFAANSFGKIALTKNARIKFLKTVKINDIITATCLQKSINQPKFEVVIRNQNYDEIAHFEAEVHFSSELWG